jgi:hypothetical protein
LLVDLAEPSRELLLDREIARNLEHPLRTLSRNLCTWAYAMCASENAG